MKFGRMFFDDTGVGVVRRLAEFLAQSVIGPVDARVR